MDSFALALRARVVAALILLAFGCSVAPAKSPATHPSPTEHSQTATKHSGFLFVDGQYVPPPYQIEWDEERLTINDRTFEKETLDLSMYERAPPMSGRGARGRWGMRMGRGNGRGLPIREIGFSESDRQGFRPGLRSRPGSGMDRLAQELNAVNRNAIVVWYSGKQVVTTYPSGGGYDLLKSLSTKTADEASVADVVGSGEPARVWQNLIADFRPTTEFESRLNEVLRRVEEAATQGEQIVASNLWINRFSYPLTVFAMAVVVLGFGHLLSNRPRVETAETEGHDWSKHRKVVGQSLLIVALLSCVDLIWTLGTGSAGMMREMNPLGKDLIASPAALFLFKATATGTAIAILYRLHRRPIAQVASWWCCLLLTLLTARWIVFQSMFL